MAKEKVFPKDWISRRLHSLMGLWLIIYLIEHLLTNSQAALLLGDNGRGFVQAVNWIYGLPYLPVLEVVIIGLPLLIHGIWGIKYLFTAKQNNWVSRGAKPGLGRYARNHSFSWQRITAWVLLFAIIGHVVQMRFLDRPIAVNEGTNDASFMVRLELDNGLYTVASRLGVELYDQQKIAVAEQRYDQLRREIKEIQGKMPPLPEVRTGRKERFNAALDAELNALQTLVQDKAFLKGLLDRPIQSDQVIAVAPQFGTAVLLMVRDTFRHPLWMVLYTLFVIAAVYHAFNGLWSASIVWGVTLTNRSQLAWSKVTVGLMVVLGCLGLAAVWLTYWVNLYS